ncbi:MAG: hypothetical protein KR126chlam6_01463 [Candidatus Anoxychlamydiales bacterium]|nr:hypothetical protein [Candidatus Anoxychlamydiales bacterium]
MRYLLFILLPFLLNSCNFENGAQKNYIISQMKDSEKAEDNDSQN